MILTNSKSKQSSFKRLIGIFLLGLATAIVGIAALLMPPHPEAQACRDCPFPMRVGVDRWMMPNGQVEVQIEETLLFGRVREVHVVLRSTASGEILAEGTTRVRNTRKTLSVFLNDVSGSLVIAQIVWHDTHREKIQIGLSCAGCSIQRFLE